MDVLDIGFSFNLLKRPDSGEENKLLPKGLFIETGVRLKPIIDLELVSHGFCCCLSF